MTTTNTRNLRIGTVVIVDGELRKIIAKSKAFKAPEWFITFDSKDYTITQNYSSNKKWDVVA